MNIEKLKELLKLSYKIKRTTLSLSSPGIGKSSAVYQSASELSSIYGETFSVIEVRAASTNPSELGDIKYVVNGEVKDAVQEWVPTNEKVRSGLCSCRGIVYLDEIADGTPTVQSALQRLLLDRKLGSLTLADNWHTTASSNRQSDKSAAGRLSTALINRCMTVTVEPDTDCFVKWGLKYGLHPDVIAFCRWKRTPWNFDPTRKNANPAFCSPRSMHILSDILHEVPDPDFELITGTVGDGVGSEMSGFLKLKAELPNLDDIIRDPHGAKVPTRMDIAVAVLYALIGRITDKTVGNILTFLARNPIEIAMAAFMDVCTQKPELVHNKVVQEWMTRSENVRIISMGY